MKTQPNDSAHPFTYEERWGSEDQYTRQGIECGLTKREYFAALAMQANADNENMTPAQCAEIAVQLADALITALNKEAAA